MVNSKTQLSSEANITAANTFNKPMPIYGFGNVSIYGTFTGTVTLQRSFNYHTLLQSGKEDQALWLDVDTFTENSETNFREVEYVTYYRLGIKTGNFTSGSVYVRLGTNKSDLYLS